MLMNCMKNIMSGREIHVGGSRSRCWTITKEGRVRQMGKDGATHTE